MCGALMALAITTAGAEEIDKDTANFVLPGCKAALEGRGWQSEQWGYCEGAIRTLVLMSASFAVPHGIRFERGLRVVVRYIEARPQRTHVLLIRASSAASTGLQQGE
jgi:hypothetical protein